jgi:hypothetical protein
MHNVSEMKQIVDVGSTSMQSFPTELTGQYFLHSCLHFFGLHLSALMIAILSDPSAASIFLKISGLAILKDI